MSSTASANTTSTCKPNGEGIDSAWQWSSYKDATKKQIVCDFCGHTTTGGITRAKKHQLGIKGDVRGCKKIPPDIKRLLQESFDKKKAANDAFMIDIEDDDAGLQEIADLRAGKRHASVATKAKSNVKGTLDGLMFQKPEVTLKKTKAMEKSQTSIKDSFQKEARGLTNQYIARFFYKNSIPFNVVRSESFRLMIEAVGNYGPHLKPPSFHELRVPLLKKEVELTKEMLQGLVRERTQYGCSIMSDAWTDQKTRTLINFLVNSPSGTMLVRSMDCSDIVKSGKAIFDLLDSFIQEIGEENVVQVISDNGSNYVLAGKYLEDKYPKLFWTLCAAHCVDLMLEDIGKLPIVKRAITRGQFLVGFIYNHCMVLNIMRTFTGGAELIRSGVTRFATTFLTLQRLFLQKNNLRRMFVSEEWMNTKVSKEAKGKRAYSVVLKAQFWNDVLFSLKAMGSLVEVLRLVDNEKKPAMGYIYEAMDKAKESIATAFNKKMPKYADIFAIIDKRWELQLHRPLHAAGHFLNPNLFYNDPNIGRDREVTDGLYACIEKLSVDNVAHDRALQEIADYRRATGQFGTAAAKRMLAHTSPAEWWLMYGNHVPYLQTIVVKVLSLTCSSSGCERNWSTFEHIHSKKRSRLEHQKLQDLVFVKYNQALLERFKNKDLTDPIILDNIDECYEWLAPVVDENGIARDDMVVGEDGLTWDVVGDAAGANEPERFTRHQSTRTRVQLDGNEEIEVEEQEFEPNDEQDAINVIDIQSEDEAEA